MYVAFTRISCLKTLDLSVVEESNVPSLNASLIIGDSTKAHTSE